MAVTLVMTKRIEFEEWGVLPPEVRWRMIQNNVRVVLKGATLFGGDENIFRNIKRGSDLKNALLSWCDNNCSDFYFCALATSSFYFLNPSDQVSFKLSMADLVAEFNS